MKPTSRAGSRYRSHPGVLPLLLGLGWGIATGAVAAGLQLPAQTQTQAQTQSPADPQPQPTAASQSRPRSIVLNLTSRSISLVENGAVLGTWPVAIGDPASPTPTGRFAVVNKVVNPQYQSTRSGRIHATVGANGPLGDRWLGFHSSGSNQYGIHGTPDAWAWAVTSRAAVTHGCVRMLRAHVHQLFDQVEVGTPVLIVRR